MNFLLDIITISIMFNAFSPYKNTNLRSITKYLSLVDSIPDIIHNHNLLEKNIYLIPNNDFFYDLNTAVRDTVISSICLYNSMNILCMNPNKKMLIGYYNQVMSGNICRMRIISQTYRINGINLKDIINRYRHTHGYKYIMYDTSVNDVLDYMESIMELVRDINIRINNSLSTNIGLEKK